MKNFFLFITLILSFAFDANAGNTSSTLPKDETSTVICKIIDYTHSLGGPMITIVDLLRSGTY